MMNDVSFRGHIPLHEDGMMVISSTKHGGEVAAAVGRAESVDAVNV